MRWKRGLSWGSSTRDDGRVVPTYLHLVSPSRIARYPHFIHLLSRSHHQRERESTMISQFTSPRLETPILPPLPPLPIPFRLVSLDNHKPSLPSLSNLVPPTTPPTVEPKIDDVDCRRLGFETRGGGW